MTAFNRYLLLPHFMINLLDKITSSAAWGFGSIYEQKQTANPHSYAVRDLLVLAGWDARVEQRIVLCSVFNVMIWLPADRKSAASI